MDLKKLLLFTLLVEGIYLTAQKMTRSGDL